MASPDNVVPEKQFMVSKIMSSFAINNNSRTPCDCSNVELPSFENLERTIAQSRAHINFMSKEASAYKNTVAADNGVKDNPVDMTTIVSMFATFFNQVLTLLASKKDGTLVNPDTKPAVLPAVTPQVVVPQPTPGPNDLPDLSSKRAGAKADNIWSGFRQGPDGNCVTVSAIKAAMHKFGQSPTDIYKEVRPIDGGYRVIMRDDFQLTLTRQELAAGARGSQFVGSDKGMLKDAQFLFAVSAKRAQMENNDNRAARSFDAAIKSLNDGEDERGAGEGFKRLGLRKHMKSVPVSTLARGQVGMVNRTGHSVAIIEGKEELWGRRGSAPTRGDAIALMD